MRYLALFCLWSLPSSVWAAEHGIPERSETSPTGWYWYTGISEADLNQKLKQTGCRLVDIEVESTSPYRFTAAMVKNQGPLANGWWWYFGKTEQQVNALIKSNRARLIDVEAYHVNGKLRFAVVMVSNTGSKAAPGWWWYFGKSSAELKSLLAKNKARLIDLDRYRDGGKTRFAAVMVRNTGTFARGWYWYLGASPEFIRDKCRQHRARLLDVEKVGSNAFDVVMLVENDLDAGRPMRIYKNSRLALVDRDLNTRTRVMWLDNLTRSEVDHYSTREGSRVIDVEPTGSGDGKRFSVLLLANGVRKTGGAVAGLAPLESRLVDWMRAYNIPGMSVGVMKGNKIIYARGFGWADIGRRTAMTAAHYQRIASISKPVTKSAIDALGINLDDKVYTYLTDIVHPSQIKDPRVKQITIRHLIEHKGGFVRKVAGDPMFMSNEICQALKVKSPAGPRDIIKFVFTRVSLQYDPGDASAYSSKDRYSNFGYCLLGRVIEKKSGMSYDAYLRKVHLPKAGISGMRVGRTLFSKRLPGEAVYYMYPLASRGKSVFLPPPLSLPVNKPYGAWHLEAMDAHGGLIANVYDLLKGHRRFKWASHDGALDGTRTFLRKFTTSDGEELIVVVLCNSWPLDGGADGGKHGEAFTQQLNVAVKLCQWPK